MTATATGATLLCGVDDLGDEEILKIELEGRAPLAVSRFEGKYFVSDDICPHAEASLSDGYVEEGRIICPVHFAEFDLGSGDVHNPPAGCGKLRFYPVTITDGSVFAELD